MKIEQQQWTLSNNWQRYLSESSVSDTAQLVMAFGARTCLQAADRYEEIRSMYPNAHVLLCSTAGEILGAEVDDDTISLTAIEFEKTKLAFATASISEVHESYEVGKQVARSLSPNGLVHTLIFSDGLRVNGTALVEGVTTVLPEDVSVTGGLVGDGVDFKQTVIGFDGEPNEGKIVLIGFYGSDLKVGYGSLGGWDPFGPERTITRSENNILYELDGRPALELYKEYLGEQAYGLPATGLKFPLRLTIQEQGSKVEVVRTLLSINEDTQSMTFAGDMPEGVEVTLMKANFERLVDGATGAATMSGIALNGEVPDLALLISCIGRKLVLKDGVEEETEAVRAILGEDVAMAGFYSYGEISPAAATEKQCRLHNQTMTITTFKEI